MPTVSATAQAAPRPMLHDLVIVGAGPVGATLALALAEADLDVVALDARPVGAAARADRSLALSHGARLIFERLGAWAMLASIDGAVTPITAIDVSQQGGFGMTELSADDQGLPALGYVVSYRALQTTLDAALARAGVDLRLGAAVEGVGGTPAYASVTLRGAPRRLLTARLCAVADGSATAIDGIARRRRDYGQVALTAKVWTERPHEGRAFERFTPHGPMALLPEADHRSVVWTMTPVQAQAVMALPDEEFLAALAAHFGARVGRFSGVAGRRTHPLALEYARPTIAARVVVLGNAAQALHPVAGQGLNLGLRDAYELARSVVEAPRERLGDRAMLVAYAAARRPDRVAGIAFTDSLLRMFGTDHVLLRWPRGLALTLLDAVPPAKRAFTRAMLFGVR